MYQYEAVNKHTIQCIRSLYYIVFKCTLLKIQVFTPIFLYSKFIKTPDYIKNVIKLYLKGFMADTFKKKYYIAYQAPNIYYKSLILFYPRISPLKAPLSQRFIYKCSKYAIHGLTYCLGLNFNTAYHSLIKNKNFHLICS